MTAGLHIIIILLIKLKLVCRLKTNDLKKYKEDNNILKAKRKDLENRLTYMQHKLTNLDNKKTSHILDTGVLEVNT